MKARDDLPTNFPDFPIAMAQIDRHLLRFGP